jgi:hypothetical protein
MSQHLIVAGWTLVTVTPRPPYAGDSLPQQLLTISDCLQEDLPRPVAADWYTEPGEAADAHRQQAPHAILAIVAMVPDDADDFRAQFDGDPHAADSFSVLRRHIALDPTAVVLGYEIVGAEYTLDFHSWHCHGYADEVADALGIRTNAYGLLGTRDEARTVLDWMLARPPSETPKEVPWTVIALATTEQVAGRDETWSRTVMLGRA